MGHIDEPILGVGICAGLFAVFALGTVARGGGLEFHDIEWPQHDRRTGFITWSLRAKDARPDGNDEFLCSVVEMTTYKQVQAGTQQQVQKDMVLRADKGIFVRGFARSSAKLSGNINGRIEGVDPLDIRVHGADAVADVQYASDDARGIQERIVTTASSVSAESKSRTLTGTGMRLFDRASRDDLVPPVAQMVLDRDVVVKMTGTSGLQPFAALPSSAPAAAETGPVTATASCAGKLVYDRLANRAEMERNTRLIQGDTTMQSDTLVLAFEEGGLGAEGEVRLKSLLAEGNVRIITPEQNFFGSRFHWDAAKGHGRLDGRPATMDGPGRTGKADAIEFDQQNQLIIYVGNAEVLLKLKAE